MLGAYRVSGVAPGARIPGEHETQARKGKAEWRKKLYKPCLGETLSQSLDAHERAFEYFGRHTREHVYDRPWTICQPSGERRVVLPGRTFVDEQESARLARQWQPEIADVCIHGRPTSGPRTGSLVSAAAIATGNQPVRLEASQPRRVDEGLLVSFETNRYSVLFMLIGRRGHAPSRSIPDRR